MPEAVFSISANISPQIDERELEQQAQLLASKLNGILGKHVDKVGLRGDTRAFQEVQNQIQNTSRATRLLQNTLGLIPRTIKNVAGAARSTFLKFSDAINLTRRGIVGFGGSILDMIKRTNLFESALENLQGTGDTFRELPGSFQVLAAQVRSGTSALDAAAASGDRFAQGLLPITRFSGASLEAISKLTEEVENLSINFANMGSMATRGLGALRSTAGTINRGFKNVLSSAQSLTQFLEPGTRIFADFNADLREASSVEELVGGMVNLKNATERVTGPLGLVRQLIGTLSKEERQAAQDLERGLKKSLLEIDPSQLTGFERFTTRVRNFGDSVVSAARAVRQAQKIIADFIPGESIGESAADFGTFFRVLRADGISTTDALKQAFAEVFKNSSFGLFFNKVNTGFREMVVNAAVAGRFIKDDLTRAFEKVKKFSIGDTVNSISDAFNSFVASAKKFSLGDAIGNGVNAASDKINEFTRKAKEAVGGLAKGSEAKRAAAALASTKAAEVAATKARADALAKAAAEETSRPSIRVQKAATDKHIIIRKQVQLKEPATTELDAAKQLAPQVAALNAVLQAGHDQVTGLAATANRGLLDIMGVDITKGAAVDKSFIQNIKADIATLSNGAEAVGTETGEALGRGARGGFRGFLRAIKDDIRALSDETVAKKVEPVVAKQKEVTPKQIQLAKPKAAVFDQQLAPQVAAINQVLQAGHDQVTGLAATANHGLLDIMGVDVAKGKAVDAAINEANQKVGFLRKGINGLKGSDNGAFRALGAGFSGLGSAASLALAPVRLLHQAVGKTLQAGLQLSTAAVKVAGTALAGFVGVAIATGVQFNSLQAVIRSTLPVILGSAEASEKLLVEINALNDTSPFARSAFLELTRVLAGFGVQAEKITPLIDAIQQAVAATGGGEADLLELGQAFARLQSQGRLSLDIIQSFSSRGIDVISILGQEFGKTQGEVRDMISDGLIPAGKAIDALTKGLKEKFDGATDAVAKNLPGALDRVKARTRDFGAELTRAFVSPTGGGAVIDLLNSFATIVGVITKQFLPLLRPALDAVAAAITNISTKAAAFAKTMGSFEAGKLKEFAGGLDGLLGPLVALVALLPVFAQTIPVIGPLFASLVGAVPLATIAITAFLLTLKPVRDGLGEFVKGLAPLGAGLLPKMAAAFKSLGNAIGPIVGVWLKALGPIVVAAGNALGALFDELPPIFDAFKRLFTALEPLIAIVKVAYMQAFRGLQLAFKVLGPTITFIINLVAALAEKVKPAAEAFAEWFENMSESVDVEKVFNTIASSVEWVVNKLKGFLAIFNNILRFLHIPEITIDLDMSPAEVAVASILNLTEEQTEALKKQATEIDKSADAFHDGYSKTKKAAEDADAAVGQITDSLKQQMSAFQQDEDALVSAGLAVRAAQAAQKEASAKAKEAAQNVTDVIKEQAKALRDVIAPTDELAVAQRNLVRTQNDLRDLDRQEVDLQKELADLRGDAATDERAALDRALERAKIALNKAQKEQNDLLNEGNKAEKTNLDLTGLTVDQIKTRLSTVRASLKAQRDTKEPTTTKSPQETADEKQTAALDVADATQAVKDAGKARAQFELDNTRNIRDNEEQIAAISADRADKLLDEKAQLNHLADLRAGETAQLAVIKDFEDKIKAARDANATAVQAVTAAITETSKAELELKAKSAEIRGDYVAMESAQRALNELKRDGLTFDQETEGFLKKQAANISQVITDLGKAKAERDKLAAEVKRDAAKDLAGRLGQRQFLDEQVRRGVHDPKVLSGIGDSQESIEAALNAISASGGIVNKAGESVVLTKDQITELIMDLVEEQVRNPNSTFRDILKALLESFGGLKIDGLASGYAPLIHRGMNDGRGLVRMFEYGKEAVLPLTRKLDMSRVVNNPSVLPKVLDALPRISLPTTAGDPSSLLAPSRFTRPTGGGTSGGLSPLSRANTRGGQTTSVDSARRKEQREFAGSIGDAVKTAVKEALSESGGSLGSDIDINVEASSNNEAVIAREVKRQVERALGRW